MHRDNRPGRELRDHPARSIRRLVEKSIVSQSESELAVSNRVGGRTVVRHVSSRTRECCPLACSHLRGLLSRLLWLRFRCLARRCRCRSAADVAEINAHLGPALFVGLEEFLPLEAERVRYKDGGHGDRKST